jgi:hypothetical protein
VAGRWLFATADATVAFAGSAHGLSKWTHELVDLIPLHHELAELQYALGDRLRDSDTHPEIRTSATRRFYFNPAASHGGASSSSIGEHDADLAEHEYLLAGEEAMRQSDAASPGGIASAGDVSRRSRRRAAARARCRR